MTMKSGASGEGAIYRHREPIILRHDCKRWVKGVLTMRRDLRRRDVLVFGGEIPGQQVVDAIPSRATGVDLVTIQHSLGHSKTNDDNPLCSFVR